MPLLTGPRVGAMTPPRSLILTAGADFQHLGSSQQLRYESRQVTTVTPGPVDRRQTLKQSPCFVSPRGKQREAFVGRK